jgi:hypothetical protein
MRTELQTDRHNEANSRFSQLHERAQKETNILDPGIRTAIPVVEQLQTYALDRTPTGIGHQLLMSRIKISQHELICLQLAD